MPVVNSPQGAEEFAAQRMRELGFVDARTTGRGSDHGIDVSSTNALAQVKHWVKPVGRPQLQNLYGAREQRTHLELLFFSLSGYSKGAVEYASKVGIALLRYDKAGRVVAENRHARELLAAEAKRQREEERKAQARKAELRRQREEQERMARERSARAEADRANRSGPHPPDPPKLLSGGMWITQVEGAAPPGRQGPMRYVIGRAPDVHAGAPKWQSRQAPQPSESTTRVTTPRSYNGPGQAGPVRSSPIVEVAKPVPPPPANDEPGKDPPVSLPVRTALALLPVVAWVFGALGMVLEGGVGVLALAAATVVTAVFGLLAVQHLVRRRGRPGTRWSLSTIGRRWIRKR